MVTVATAYPARPRSCAPAPCPRRPRPLDPRPQRLRMHVQLARDPPDRHRPLPLGLDRVQRHPRRPLMQLIAVLLRCRHAPHSSWNQSLHRTRGAARCLRAATCGAWKHGTRSRERSGWLGTARCARSPRQACGITSLVPPDSPDQAQHGRGSAGGQGVVGSNPAVSTGKRVSAGQSMWNSLLCVRGPFS